MTQFQTMYVPRVGDHIKLEENWKFKLHFESRNSSLCEVFAHEQYKEYRNSSWNERCLTKTIDAELPKGTILKFDRVYIRNDAGSGNGETGNASSYDSVTFRLVSCPEERLNGKRHRFWVKVDSCNTIIYSKISAIIKQKK